MTASLNTSQIFRWSLRVAMAPLFVLYGLWVVLRGTIALVLRARLALRLFGDSLPCPSCGTANPLYGRWHCRAPGCGAIYHGFVAYCRMCGSGASFFPCRSCRTSIRIGTTG